MKRRHLTFGVALVVLGLTVLGWSPASRWYRAGDLLLALSGTNEPSAVEVPLSEVDVQIPHAEGTTRARIYRRPGPSRGPGLVIAHGVHYRGIDEERLVPFARELARAGLVVLTPELRDLADYRITHRSVDDITASVLYLRGRTDLIEGDRVGLLGLSFAGGLGLVAAARPALHQQLAYVVSVGGHHDLARVLRFFVTDTIETPDGVEERRAHAYGLLVLVYGRLPDLVPRADQPVMHNAIKAWLQEDRDRAKRIAADCATPECSRLFSLVEKERLSELRGEVLDLVRAHESELLELSPNGLLRSIPAPVYLLHGTADDVIPPSELSWADRELEGRDHRALVSPLIDHVEVSKDATLVDQLALVDFMSALL